MFNICQVFGLKSMLKDEHLQNQIIQQEYEHHSQEYPLTKINTHQFIQASQIQYLIICSQVYSDIKYIAIINCNYP
ncbi:unnamed protein product [Paramecium octaurelia]|uniref:Uncharacterized protein n=1 Tax=Paramecium octaurelia TaxID=43137 RepID=A0A8S1YQI2_PAROT|nr:unnamed protein product [Paramecium octaurelia]